MYAKRSVLPVLSTLCFYLLLTPGCSKSTPTAPTNGALSASAGGTNFNAQVVDGIYSQGLDLVAIIGLTQQGNDSTKVILEFSYLPPVGLAFSSDTTATGLSYNIDGRQYDAYSSNGQVVVTLTSADTVGHRFGGTFNGTVYNDLDPGHSLLITNGKFSSTYSVQP